VARDALCQAVLLAHAVTGAPAPLPDPSYRAAVAERLRPPARQRLLGPRSYADHPVLWSGVGAAAALLLALGFAVLSHSGQETVRPDGSTPATPGQGIRHRERPLDRTVCGYHGDRKGKHPCLPPYDHQ
jgi:hypothetical protein